MAARLGIQIRNGAPLAPFRAWPFAGALQQTDQPRHQVLILTKSYGGSKDVDDDEDVGNSHYDGDGDGGTVTVAAWPIEVLPEHALLTSQ